MKTTLHWSLARTQLSGFLVDEAVAEAGAGAETVLQSSLRNVVGSKEDFAALRKAVSEISPMVSQFTREALGEELEEIQEDLQWIGSSRGQYVIAINDWIRPFHKEFNAIERFAKVMIGGHTEREVVFATGSVESREDYDALLVYLASKKPPFKLLTQVTIQSEGL